MEFWWQSWQGNEVESVRALRYNIVKCALCICDNDKRAGRKINVKVLKHLVTRGSEGASGSATGTLCMKLYVGASCCSPCNAADVRLPCYSCYVCRYISRVIFIRDIFGGEEISKQLKKKKRIPILPLPQTQFSILNSILNMSYQVILYRRFILLCYFMHTVGLCGTV